MLSLTNSSVLNLDNSLLEKDDSADVLIAKQRTAKAIKDKVRLIFLEFGDIFKKY